MEATSVSQPKPIENEAFWQKHYEALNTSALSRTDYCRQYHINYDRFGYWISKWNRDKGDQLVSVKLKSTIEPKNQGIPALCTLDLKNGQSLKIHDMQILAFILEKLG